MLHALWFSNGQNLNVCATRRNAKEYNDNHRDDFDEDDEDDDDDDDDDDIGIICVSFNSCINL